MGRKRQRYCSCSSTEKSVPSGDKKVPDQYNDQEDDKYENEDDQDRKEDDLEFLDNSWFEERTLSIISLLEEDQQKPPNTLHQSTIPEKEGEGREYPGCQDASTISMTGDSLANIGAKPTTSYQGEYKPDLLAEVKHFGGNLGAVPKLSLGLPMSR